MLNEYKQKNLPKFIHAEDGENPAADIFISPFLSCFHSFIHSFYFMLIQNPYQILKYHAHFNESTAQLFDYPSFVSLFSTFDSIQQALLEYARERSQTNPNDSSGTIRNCCQQQNHESRIVAHFSLRKFYSGFLSAFSPPKLCTNTNKALRLTITTSGYE